jgi:hypothetical protein
MTTLELTALLAKKYTAPEYAFIEQVRNQTGYGNEPIRTADALALSLWKSRGIYLHGFEVKVSRGDWLHEVKDPAKSDAVASYCDYFWLVIPELKIIDVSEIPMTWGILVVDHGVLKTAKQPVKIEAKEVSRQFLCGVMRRLADTLDTSVLKTDVERIVKERVEGEIDSKINAMKYQYARAVTENEAYKKNIAKFCEYSGVQVLNGSLGSDGFYMDEWLKDIGSIFQQIRNGEYLRQRKNLEKLREATLGILAGIDKATEGLDTAQ